MNLQAMRCLILKAQKKDTLFGVSLSLSVIPAVKKSYLLISEYVVLAFVESALHKIGIVHIHNAVLNSVVVFVKNISNCLFACFVCADISATCVLTFLNYLSNACISVKAHCVFYSLSNERSAYKAA